MTDATCNHCGGPMPALRSDGKPRRFCSPSCAQRGKAVHGCHPRGRLWTPDEDAELRRFYDGRTETVSRLATRLGRKRSSVTNRAQLLGLSRGRRHPTRWSAEMDERLAALVTSRPWAAIARALGVSETAVRVRAKRLALHRSGYAFSAMAAAEIIGADRHKVLGWIDRGLLTAERTSDVARSTYRIGHAALRRFILAYPGEIDLRRIETSGFKATFLDIVANAAHGAGTMGLDSWSRGEGDEEGLC